MRCVKFCFLFIFSGGLKTSPCDLYKWFDVKICFYVLYLSTTLPGTNKQAKHCCAEQLT
jgi:hypothetical protein